MSVLYSQKQKDGLANQVALLTSLPPTPTSPPAIPSGTVALFADPNWNSKRVDVNINDYISGKRQKLPASIVDEATWIAWNLPLGIVMTMTDNVQGSTSSISDLTGAGGVLDLVGSGSTRSTELYKTDLNDGIAAFYWREVDLWQGGIEVFRDANFARNWFTIWLCEWPRDTPNNITSWWMNDRISSFRWKSLNDRQTAAFYNDPDGKGTRYENIKGWGSFKEIAKASDYGVDDSISSFSWSTISPKKEIVDPIVIPSSSIKNATSLNAYNNGNNNSELEQTSQVKLEIEEAQTVTVETSDTNHVGMSVKLTQTVRAGAEGIATSETSLELGFSYDFTTTKTTTRSTSKTLRIGLTQDFKVPAYKHYDATLTASVGQLPVTDYQTKVTRWYDYPVPGGTQDSSTNNWYKREETVAFRVGGSLMSTMTFNMTTSKLP